MGMAIGAGYLTVGICIFLLVAFAKQGFKIRSMTKSKEKTIMDSDTALIIDMELDKKRSHTDVLTLFRNLDYINYVEEV